MDQFCSGLLILEQVLTVHGAKRFVVMMNALMWLTVADVCFSLYWKVFYVLGVIGMVDTLMRLTLLLWLMCSDITLFLICY